MKNQYSLVDKILLVIFLFRTKLICKDARIFRFPLDIRGRKFIDFGAKLTLGYSCRLEAFSEDGNITMHIGDNVQFNDNVHITAMKNVTIGNNVLLASNIYISDCTHGIYKGNDQTSPYIAPIERPYHLFPVFIDDNVWIGENVCILPGVIIGKGSIVGAGSIVSKSIPEYSIVVGVPARIIKRYCLETQTWRRTNSQGEFID